MNPANIDAADVTLPVALHGVTGRMGSRQHFARSILPIMHQGGVRLADGRRVTVEPVLVGRDQAKLRHLAEEVAQAKIGRSVRWTTDLDKVLSDPEIRIFFDAASTQLRPAILVRAAQAGKAVYCEKPIGASLKESEQLADACERTGVLSGVVQDKLWLPGIRKLKSLLASGFFDRVLSVRGEFGYWVFTGHEPDRPAQRPSWNYRSEDGGGMIIDMFCHWQYLLEDLFGPIRSVLAVGRTDLPERIDERGQAYRCTAEDSAYAIFELADGIICQFSNSWTTRVRRDDLLTIQVDGTHGSAVAGLRDVVIQPAGATPPPIWDPDVPQPLNFFEGWLPVPEATEYDNAFKIQWELFLKHVASDGAEPFPWTLRRGVRGVRLAEAGLASWRERRWVDLEAFPAGGRQ